MRSCFMGSAGLKRKSSSKVIVIGTMSSRKKRGHVCPWDAYPDLSSLDDYSKRTKVSDKWRNDNIVEIDKWRDICKAIQEEFGVELGWHCSHECAMPYLSLGEVTMACRGYPITIGRLPTVGPDWNEKLDKWLTEFSIEKPHDNPEWWLCSFWG